MCRKFREERAEAAATTIRGLPAKGHGSKTRVAVIRGTRDGAWSRSGELPTGWHQAQIFGHVSWGWL